MSVLVSHRPNALSPTYGLESPEKPKVRESIFDSKLLGKAGLKLEKVWSDSPKEKSYKLTIRKDKLFKQR